MWAGQGLLEKRLSKNWQGSCQLLCLYTIPQPWGEISFKPISPLAINHVHRRQAECHWGKWCLLLFLHYTFAECLSYVEHCIEHLKSSRKGRPPSIQWQSLPVTSALRRLRQEYFGDFESLVNESWATEWNLYLLLCWFCDETWWPKTAYGRGYFGLWYLWILTHLCSGALSYHLWDMESPQPDLNVVRLGV